MLWARTLPKSITKHTSEEKDAPLLGDFPLNPLTPWWPTSRSRGWRRGASSPSALCLLRCQTPARRLPGLSARAPPLQAPPSVCTRDSAASPAAPAFSTMHTRHFLTLCRESNQAQQPRQAAQVHPGDSARYVSPLHPQAPRQGVPCHSLPSRTQGTHDVTTSVRVRACRCSRVSWPNQVETVRKSVDMAR